MPPCSTLTRTHTHTHTHATRATQPRCSNGLGQALVSIGRAVCPALVTPLFAFSVSDANMALGPPFDFGLTFYLCGICLLGCCWWSSRLPKSLDVKRVDT